MPTLAEMLAAKKAKEISNSNQEVQHGELSTGASAADTTVESGAINPTPSVVVEKQPEQLPPTNQVAQAPAANRPVVGGLRLNALRLGSAPIVRPAGAESASQGSNRSVRESVPSDAAGLDDSNAQPSSGDGSQPSAIGNLKLGGSLVDIAGLGNELDGIDPEEEDTIPLDHIPATAPSRKLPENLTDQQAQFIKSLDSIYRLHADPSMFVDMVRRIMTDMQENPALVSLLADEDSFTMITGLRQQAGMAQVKKIEAKEKKGTGGGARSAKNKSIEDSVMASLSAFAGASFD